MGDMRIRYGLAYGRQNNFVAGSTDQTTRGYLAGSDGLFKQADTTPDVTTGILFYTNNSAATTITDFEFQHPSSGTGNLSGLFEGKVIKVFFLDTNTTIQNSARVVLADSANHIYNSNEITDFIYHNSAWYEMNRMDLNPAPATGYRSLSVAGTNLAISVTPADRTIALVGTIALTTLTGISGGYIGQTIVIVQQSGGGTILVSNTGSAIGLGNIYVMGTASFLIAGAGSANGVNNIALVKMSSAYWTTYAYLPR